MEKLVKRIFAQLGSFTVGAGLIAANGVFMLTQKQPENIVHADPIPAETVQNDLDSDGETAEEKSIEQSMSGVEERAVKTISAADLPESSNVKKASLDDYRMLLKIDKKKTKAEKAAEKAAKAYDAVYEIDTTEIYDPQPEPLNFTETRSVADEYYTVNDIISGNTVTLNAHELLCRAVYSEIGGEWDEDAIKAQVVAAYSFLRFNDSIGLTPTVGLKADYPEVIEKCVSAVEGQAVYYDGEIINAVYSASTAGYSVESERIWDVYYPYLRAVVSEYDCNDPNYGLEYVFTEAEIKAKFEEALSITMSDDVENWFVMDDIYSGRYVGYVTVDGQERITARTFEETLDLKSQAFTVNYEDGNVIIHTFGWGHGVGMSQWGACYYAENGYTYDQILRHYYLNTTIELSQESQKAVNRGSQLDSVSEDSSVSDSSENSSEDISSSDD